MFHIPGVSKISSNIKSGALLEIKGFLLYMADTSLSCPSLFFILYLPFIYEEIEYKVKIAIKH